MPVARWPAIPGSVEAIRDRLALREDGSGPCPLCGGEDRFSLRAHDDGRRVILFCRGCDRNGTDRARLRSAVLARLGRSDPLRAPDGAPARPRPAARPPKAKTGSASSPVAVALLSASRRAADTPAALHLCDRRRCWNPAAPLPDAVRWVPRGRWPRLPGLPPLPTDAAGVLLYRLASGEAVHLGDALHASGEPAREPQRLRRTLGPRAPFEIAGGTDGGPLVLSEGPTDALALRWLRPDAGTIRAAVGRLRADDGRDWPGSVLLAPDADTPGRLAAVKVLRALPSASVLPPLRPDPADALRARLDEAGNDWAAAALPPPPEIRIPAPDPAPKPRDPPESDAVGLPKPGYTPANAKKFEPGPPVSARIAPDSPRNRPTPAPDAVSDAAPDATTPRTPDAENRRSAPAPTAARAPGAETAPPVSPTAPVLPSPSPDRGRDLEGRPTDGLTWPLRDGSAPAPVRARCGLWFGLAATAALHADGCPRCAQD